MDVGFIGLGNLGAKLAGSLLRNGFDLTVLDLDRAAAAALLARGASWADTPTDLARRSDVVITCLPSPHASAVVVEGDDGVLAGLRPGSAWIEMSTTDPAEVRRLTGRVAAGGGLVVDAPVSGGCHRAATGNIAIFAGCDREVFDHVLPLLTAMGGSILHTGPVGSASTLKLITNYLATAHLVALGEALVTAERSGMDLTTTYEAIRISSGNSFVNETEGQLILNGSRNIGFTMDLVLKDIALFQALADRRVITLDLSPVLVDVVADAVRRYGGDEWSSNVVRRLEDATGATIHAPGFPAELADDQPPQRGREVPTRGTAVASHEGAWHA